ncbi:MAG: hypothetical protein ACK5FV_16820, partial [Bacteroidota bacterium]
MRDFDAAKLQEKYVSPKNGEKISGGRFSGSLPDLELVQDSLTESKTSHFSPFFTFFQLRSSGYAPSKMQKLTKNQ